MSAQKAPKPEARENGRMWVDVVVVAAVVSAALGGTLWLWAIGAGRWADQPFLNVVTWAGAFVSLVSVLLAYLIFRRQSRQARKSERWNRQVLSDLGTLVSRVDGKVDGLLDAASRSVSDADVESGSGIDLWQDVLPVDEREEGTYLVGQTGKRRRIYLPGSVPLAVIGALVRVWRDEKRTGRWDLSTLRGAFRAEGKGNHPWYLVFVPPGQEDPVLWKVTRGPNDTDAAVEIRVGGQL